MNSKNKKILISVAIVMFLLAFLAFAYLAVDYFTTDENDPKKSESSDEYEHDPVEYKYDKLDRLTAEIYYENDVYMGQTTYYYDGNSTHMMVYDKDDNLIENSLLTVNAFGKPTKQENYINGELSSVYECTYHDDLQTPQIETKIEYENGDELATKSYYRENGFLYLTRELKNGEIINETDYEEESTEKEAEK